MIICIVYTIALTYCKCIWATVKVSQDQFSEWIEVKGVVLFMGQNTVKH